MKTRNAADRNGVLSYQVLAVMGFAALGIFSFGLVCVFLLLSPDALSGDPVRGPVLALTHLVTLGWIASLLFAGAYLLGPILAGSELWSARLPVFHLLCHVCGLALMLGGLLVLRYDLASYGAVIVFAGLVALVFNLMKTAAKRSLWTPSNLGFQTSFFWLAVTGGVALFMLRSRLTGQMIFAPEMLIALHAHFALFGFLAQALLAVSLRIVPDLARVEKMPSWLNRLGWAGWIFLNTGLLVLFPVVLAGFRGTIFAAGALIALGVIGHAAQIGGCLLLRGERLTWGTITHATGILLLVVIVLGALWSFPPAGEGSSEALRSWMRLYISLSLLGPFAFAILGTGERIVPRLIWRLRFIPWAAHADLPNPSSLGREAAGGPVFFSLLMAWGYLAVGQIFGDPHSIRLGAILLLVAFAWFLVAVSPALLRFALGVTPNDLPGFPGVLPSSPDSPIQKTST